MNGIKKLLCFALALLMLPILPSYAGFEGFAPPADYNGEGMCIAILDTGFDLTHETFGMSADSVKITKEQLRAALPELNAQADDGAWFSEKIPFAYNYAAMSTDVSENPERGTYLLSAAAGNTSGRAPGIAPGAQVLAMKICDSSMTLDEEILILAMKDAARLGADVILLPAYEACGFAADPASAFCRTVTRLCESGILVLSSAGDTGDPGTSTVYSRTVGLTGMTSDQPDGGSISYPGSFPAVFTAGSTDTNLYSTNCLLLGDAIIPYSDSNAMFDIPPEPLPFADRFEGMTLSYEVIDGIGKPEDFLRDGKAPDLTGKLAMIPRGELTFTEKASNAAALGAIGVIIVDNQKNPEASLTLSMDLTDSPIPAILVSEADGKKLTEAAVKRITVDSSLRYTLLLQPTPSPSAFTSVGPAPDLTLKPDVSVIGSNVECAAPDQSYAAVTSTDIAAARLAGIAACTKQRLLAEGDSSDPAILAGRVRALIASSAQLMLNADGKIPYSPRIQGGGAADLSRALDAGLLVTLDKTSLGEIDGSDLTLTVTVENLEPVSKTCTLDAILGSDGYDTFTYEILSDIESGDQTIGEMLGKAPSDTVHFTTGFEPFKKARIMVGDCFLQLNAMADDAEPYTFTLKPYSRNTVRISVVLDSQTQAEYRKAFPNGFFIEGFVRVRTDEADGPEEASVPFLGFDGDWSTAPALETEIYSGLAPIRDSIYLWRSILDPRFGGILLPGQNPFADPRAPDYRPDAARLTFSPTADAKNASVWLNLGLLRSLRDLTVSVYSPDGEVILRREIGPAIRTYPGTYGYVSPRIELWDGRSPELTSYVYPDGSYTVEIAFTKAADPEGLRESRSWELILDGTPPVLVAHSFTDTGDKKMLSLTTSDTNGTAYIFLSDSNYDSPEEAGIFGEDGTVLFDVSTLTGDYIYAEIYDAAMNCTVERLANPFARPAG